MLLQLQSGIKNFLELLNIFNFLGLSKQAKKVFFLKREKKNGLNFYIKEGLPR